MKLKNLKEEPTPGNPLLHVFDVAEFSTYDGPGTRVVVYFQGCPAQCDWCHSPHSQPFRSPLLFNPNRCIGCGRCAGACPEGVHSFQEGLHLLNRAACRQCGACIEACPASTDGVNASALHLPTRSLTVGSLIRQIEPYLQLTGKTGGITLSGGEALRQPKAARQLLQYCKQKNYHTAVETSGLLPLATYEAVWPWVDLWLFGMRVTTGHDAPRHDEHIREVLTLLGRHQACILPRIPLVPGFFDRDEVLQRIAGLLAEFSLRSVWLNPWNSDYALYYRRSGISLRMAPPTPEEIRACEGKVTAFFTHLNIELYGNNNIQSVHESESRSPLQPIDR